MVVYVRLECGPAGMSIEEAAISITAAARRLGMSVICGFNGIDVIAGPSTAIGDVVNQYVDDIRFRRDIEMLQACPVDESAAQTDTLV